MHHSCKLKMESLLQRLSRIRLQEKWLVIE
jgi:hypothetical protein